MSPSEVRYGVSQRIATITLNRPERLNAYTASGGAALSAENSQGRPAEPLPFDARSGPDDQTPHADFPALPKPAFARRGRIAEHGISHTLPRLVGLLKALALLVSARKFDAAEALRLGLVDQKRQAAFTGR